MTKNLKHTLITALFTIILLCSISCKKSFLAPEPLSFYLPETAYTNVAGMQAALVACARNLRFEYYGGNPPILTEMLFTEIAVEGTTDKSGPAQDLNLLITPDGVTFNNDDRNKIGVYWDEAYRGIKYANTVISRIDNITYGSKKQRNYILGAAYFHRALRYYRLTHQFGDVPAIMKEINEPKLDFYSVKRDVILNKIKLDLDSALMWTKDTVILNKGEVTSGAVGHLLTKVNLALGNFDEAITAASGVIDGGSYNLMKAPFGSAAPPSLVPAGSTIPVALPTNVIWDLHRPENKSLGQNREGLFMIIDRFGEGQFGTGTTIMRQAVPFWGSNIKTPSGKVATNDNTNPEFIQSNLVGRGIGRTRPSNYAQYEIWNDAKDLRHARGNWMNMEDLLYNDMGLKTANDPWYLKNLQLKNATGGLLTTDTIRSYFGWPQYKLFIPDFENSPMQGGHSDWYLFRLAETFLLRAEAYFWKGLPALAMADINAVRTRANCSPITAAQVNIGTIVDERARELFYEEPRKTEMTRISYLFAKTGMAAENGKTYSLATFSDNNYLYDRVMAKNNFYKLGLLTAHKDKYTMSPYHILWPVPSTAIQANSNGIINQNKGYIGFEKNVAALDKIPE